MKGEWYTCASCGGRFEKGRSDEAAMAEYHRDFPGATEEEREIVCHDCWKRMTRRVRPPGRMPKRPVRLRFKWRFWLLHPFGCYRARKWLLECEQQIVKEVEKTFLDVLMFGETEKN